MANSVAENYKDFKEGEKVVPTATRYYTPTNPWYPLSESMVGHICIVKDPGSNQCTVGLGLVGDTNEEVAYFMKRDVFPADHNERVKRDQPATGADNW